MTIMDLNRIKSICFIVALLFFPSAFAESKNTDSHPFIVSGVIKNSGNAELIKQFTRFIANESGYPLHVVYVNTYSQLSRRLHNDPYAIGWTSGTPYVQDYQSYGQQLIAVPLYHDKPTYHSVILTRHDQTEKTLADFKGKVLAYSDPRSNSGFLSPKFALHQQGINIKQHFRLLINAGNHEGSIESLLSGIADVAAIDEYVWEAYYKADPNALTLLREVERMGPYPFTPIVAGNKVSNTNIEKILLALNTMHNSEEGEKILLEFSLDGFVGKQPMFFQPIKDMLNAVDLDSGI